MYIYSEAFKVVVYIPADHNADLVAFWLIPGIERIGENDFTCIDNEYNSVEG